MRNEKWGLRTKRCELRVKRMRGMKSSWPGFSFWLFVHFRFWFSRLMLLVRASKWTLSLSCSVRVCMSAVCPCGLIMFFCNVKMKRSLHSLHFVLFVFLFFFQFFFLSFSFLSWCPLILRWIFFLDFIFCFLCIAFSFLESVWIHLTSRSQSRPVLRPIHNSFQFLWCMLSFIYSIRFGHWDICCLWFWYCFCFIFVRLFISVSHTLS